MVSRRRVPADLGAPLSFSEVLHGDRIKIVNYNQHVSIAILTFADSLAWLLAAFSLSCVSPAFLYNLIFFFFKSSPEVQPDSSSLTRLNRC